MSDSPSTWPSEAIQRYDGPDRARTIRYFYRLGLGIVTATRLDSVNALGELVVGYRREADSGIQPRTVQEAERAGQRQQFLNGYHTTSTIQRAPLHIAGSQAQQRSALYEQAELTTSLWFAMENWRTIEGGLNLLRHDTASRLQQAETSRRRLLGSIFGDGVVVVGKPNPGAAKARLVAAQRIIVELGETLSECQVRNTKRLEQVAQFLDWNNYNRALLLDHTADPVTHESVANIFDVQKLLIAKFDVFARDFLSYWLTTRGTDQDWYAGTPDHDVIRHAYLTEWAWEQFDSVLSVLEHNPSSVSSTTVSELSAMMPSYCTDPVHASHYDTVGYWMEQLAAADTPATALKLVRRSREAVRFRARSLPHGKAHPPTWLPDAQVWMPRDLARHLRAA